MIPLKIDKIKLKFFDSRVLSAADKARYGFLTYAGGWIRKTSRRSQRPEGKKRAVSKPGEPPRSHKGSRIKYKDTIQYYVEKAIGKMYCGAHLLNGKGGHKCPKSLEYGGPVDVFIDTNSGLPGTPSVRQKITVNMQARPHQRPALEKFVKQEQDKMLKNMVKPL